MPMLDWPSFKKLPGDSRTNFENLCRGIVRLQWAKYGEFAALKNQPGVEFHLKLLSDCPSLGEASRWYGWQCKMFDLAKDGSLTSASKTKITESLDKTVEHLPDLTDWVLWTPYTLTKKDQLWFDGLKPNYRYSLHSWSESEVDTFLSGPALMLRGAYFGDLVLTPEDLKARHEESITPIKSRWINPVHQETGVERTIRRMLGEPKYWEDMVEVGQRLSKAADAIESWTLQDRVSGNQRAAFVEACRSFSQMLLQFHSILSEADIDVIRQWLAGRQSLIKSEVLSFPRELRKRNIPVALEAANALDDMRVSQALFDEVNEYLRVGIVAVLADAGGGKTHMAAEISSAQKARPAGILLHGKNFHRGQNHNDLARQFSINGTPLDSMEKMLVALDAAAKRANCILPLVIDGLNEAENPKDWKDALSNIQIAVRNYPNVLVICTLRTGEHKRQYWSRDGSETRESFAVLSLPEDIRKFETEGFGEDVMEAIHKYFEYYKIDCEDGVEVPSGFLSHPLNLRIFCDVTNRERKNHVEISYFPASLAHLFDEYIKSLCSRIAEMRNLSYSFRDLKNYIYQLGISMWEEGDRELSDTIYRNSILDSNRPWGESVVNLFAQEGLIFRNPADRPGEYVITPVYDALGGHIIADALITKYSDDREFGWIKQSSVISAFEGGQSHPLADDIFRSLVALVPVRMYGEQLWRKLSPPHRLRAVLYAAELGPEHLDEETVSELAKIIQTKGAEYRRIFSRLWLTKGAQAHPLNANFLNEVLLKMKVDERDLGWTEWVRSASDNYHGYILQEITKLETKWKDSTPHRSSSDRLRAVAIKWLLSSTDKSLRNAATRALYWYGRGDPEFIFNEAIASLKINDPYIPERMMGASYGVAMSLCVQLPHIPNFTNGTLLKFAGQVYQAMFRENAEHSTTHLFMRDFASKVIELAQYHNPGFFSEKDTRRAASPFPRDTAKKWGERYLENESSFLARLSQRFKSALGAKLYRKLYELLPEKIRSKAIDRYIKRKRQSPFLMDFENYTIGSLVPSRGNYDYGHKEYQKVRAQLQWRVEQLGWSYEKFQSIEAEIQQSQERGRFSDDKKKIDRYGKKYSWIAFYEMFGELKDREVLDNDYWSRSDANNIDPSFSDPLESTILIRERFLDEENADTQGWIKDGAPPDIRPYLRLETLGSEAGPWIALDGFVKQQNKDLRRQSFFFVRSFLVPDQHLDEILNLLRKQSFERSGLPEKFDFSQTYFSEVPWSSAFPNDSSGELSFVVGTTTVTGRRPKVRISRSSKGMSIISDGEEEYQAVENEYKKFEVITPVCDLRQDVADGSAGSIQTLSKGLAAELDLIAQPQSFDLYTRRGEKVTRYAFYEEKGDKNSHHMYYLKEEGLRHFMEKNNVSLLYIIQGERTRTYSWRSGTDDEFPDPAYKIFSSIHSYRAKEVFVA